MNSSSDFTRVPLCYIDLNSPSSIYSPIRPMAFYRSLPSPYSACPYLFPLLHHGDRPSLHPITFLHPRSYRRMMSRSCAKLGAKHDSCTGYAILSTTTRDSIVDAHSYHDLLVTTGMSYRNVGTPCECTHHTCASSIDQLLFRSPFTIPSFFLVLLSATIHVPSYGASSSPVATGFRSLMPNHTHRAKCFADQNIAPSPGLISGRSAVLARVSTP